MKYLLYIFYVEAAISILSGAQALFAPALFLKQFTPNTPPTLTLEITRWYGVVLFVLVYLLLQGLRLRGDALKLTLQGLLFGDILQIGATFVTARALGEWTFVLIMSVALSAFYAVVRAVCLWKPEQTGIASPTQ
jgi:hypothetical protein